MEKNLNDNSSERALKFEIKMSFFRLIVSAMNEFYILQNLCGSVGI